VFVLNNYTAAEEAAIKAFGELVRYLCFGHETAPTTGTPHLQGYFNLHHAMTFRTVKGRWGGPEGPLHRAHLKLARGTASENKAYCSKEDERNFFEIGDIPKGRGSGGASDSLAALALMVKEGRPMREIADTDAATWIRNYKGIHAYAALQAGPRTKGPRTFWCYGPPGTGKSVWAFSRAPMDKTFRKNDTPWWNGYAPHIHTHVIFDDFRPWDNMAHCFKTLLHLLDTHMYTVQNKMEPDTHFRAECVIFTAPEDIRTTFDAIAKKATNSPAQNHGKEDLEQLFRRIRENGGAELAFPLAPAAVPEAHPGVLARVAMVDHAPVASAAAAPGGPLPRRLSPPTTPRATSGGTPTVRLSASPMRSPPLPGSRAQDLARRAEIRRKLEAQLAECDAYLKDLHVELRIHESNLLEVPPNPEGLDWERRQRAICKRYIRQALVDKAQLESLLNVRNVEFEHVELSDGSDDESAYGAGLERPMPRSAFVDDSARVKRRGPGRTRTAGESDSE